MQTNLHVLLHVETHYLSRTLLVVLPLLGLPTHTKMTRLKIHPPQGSIQQRLAYYHNSAETA